MRTGTKNDGSKVVSINPEVNNGAAGSVLKYTPDLAIFIVEKAIALKDLKQKGKAVNTQRASVMADVEGAGLNKKGFKRMVSLFEMDEQDRKAMAFTIAACAEALKIKEPQLDMFDKDPEAQADLLDGQDPDPALN